MGALALHAVMVACSSAGSTSSARDGGMFADVRDAIVDAVDDVLDAEVRDAHADDGGTPPACNCVAPRSENTFTGGSVNRDGMAAQRPEVDFSSAVVGGTFGRGTDRMPVLSVYLQATYYLQDGAKMIVICSLLARSDGSVVTVPATTSPAVPAHDFSCSAVHYESAEQIEGGPAVVGRPTSDAVSGSYRFTGARVLELTNERLVVSLPALPMRFTRRMPAPSTMTTPAGEGSVAPITFRAYLPGATMITPPRAYVP